MVDLKAFAECLINVTDREVEALAKILEEEYGITPARPAASANENLVKFATGKGFYRPNRKTKQPKGKRGRR